MIRVSIEGGWVVVGGEEVGVGFGSVGVWFLGDMVGGWVGLNAVGYGLIYRSQSTEGSGFFCGGCGLIYWLELIFMLGVVSWDVVFVGVVRQLDAAFALLCFALNSASQCFFRYRQGLATELLSLWPGRQTRQKARDVGALESRIRNARQDLVCSSADLIGLEMPNPVVL